MRSAPLAFYVLGIAEKSAIEHYLHGKILEVHQKLAMLG
jgi:hypothetical protein